MLFSNKAQDMYLPVSLALTLSLCSEAFSQPDSLWSRTYGGIRRDMIRCTRQTSDGGFISTGYFSVFWTGQDLTSPDLWVLKTDSQGEIEWERLYGISGEESGYWIEQTPDGGYIVGGSVFIQGTGQEALAMKIDGSGNEQWSYICDNPVGSSYCRCIKRTFDGGYILAAEYEAVVTNIVLVKLDPSGQEEWTREYNGTSFSWDYPRYVEQTLDGGYIVTGTFSDFNSGQSSLFLLKTDEFGEEEWCNYYGGEYWDTGECVHHLNGSGYIATGTFYSSYSGRDLWLLRVDELGNTIWSRRYGGADQDRGFNLEVTEDSCYFITGYTFSMGAGEEDLYALKTDFNGQLLWQRTFGGPQRDIGYCGAQLDDNGYVVSGYTYSFSEGPLFDGWVIRLASDLGVEETDNAPEPAILAFPLPFSNTLNVSLFLAVGSDVSVNVYDTAGRLVETLYSGYMQNGSNSIQWCPSGSIPSGCYFVHFQSGSCSLADKCILVR